MSITSTDDRRAITLEPTGEFYTRRQFDKRTAQFAHGLHELGVKPGDAVAWLSENSLEFPVIAMGTRRAGINHLALNTHASPAEIASILGHLRPKAVIVSSHHLARRGMHEALASLDPKMRRVLIGGQAAGWAGYDHLIERQPTSWEAIEAEVPGTTLLLSGGSTGCPKIIIRSGENENGAINVLSPGAGDVQFLGQPLYHTGPLTIMMMALLADAQVIIMQQWDNLDALHAIQVHGVTHAFFVPTMMARIVKLPAEVRGQFDLSSLRLVTHGAAPCAEEVKWAWLSMLPPTCTTVEAYGMSENFGMTVITDEEWRKHPGSVGRPVQCRIVIRDERGVEVPTGTTGTVWFVREDNAAMHYLGNEEETQASYAMRGGYVEGTAFDLGRVDEDGYLYLAGRRKDMVISGGANIYPVRTENTLLAHAAVEDAAVVGMPDDDLGEVLAAFVQLAKGVEGSAKLRAELTDHCRQQLGTFGTPRLVTFCELPRRNDGKLNKQSLRERLVPEV